MRHPSLLLWLLIAIGNVSVCQAEIVIDFGTGSNFFNVPYTEDGLTLTALTGSATWTRGPWNALPNDNSLSTGTNGFSGLQVTSNVGPIDLLSLDIRGVSAFQSNWQLQSSSGATLTLPNGFSSVTITLPALGWTGITSFSMSANAPNTGMTLDNIRFDISPVPEPSSGLLLLLGCIGMIWRRSVKVVRQAFCLNSPRATA